MRISDWSSDVCSSDLLCKGRWHTVDRRALHRGLRHGPAFFRKVAQNVHHISFQISLISPGTEQGLRIGAADRNRFSAVLHGEAFGDRERETENRMNEGTALDYAMLWIIAIHDAINRCQKGIAVALAISDIGGCCLTDRKSTRLNSSP